jgi:CheY-like chemotaxis protein
MKILIIDDDNRVAPIADAISASGHETAFFYNLREAYDALKVDQEGYDAALLDLALDGRDLPEDYMKQMVIKEGLLPGYVFFKEVMKNKYPELAERTIFITGYSDSAKKLAPEWHNEYADRIIMKTSSDFMERINELLNNFGV